MTNCPHGNTTRKACAACVSADDTVEIIRLRALLREARDGLREANHFSRLVREFTLAGDKEEGDLPFNTLDYYAMDDDKKRTASLLARIEKEIDHE